ncbi:MAG TPA: hypothetical protein PKN86_02375 [Candidatus Obscuribacter sp.]|nr:hypothetical protein [Candidatus Obscuribacter sp.]MBK9277714.1 hypothetical protein [Candidatus Obscuribacter sp.]MBL8083916.1 hypothetical protein [Candidatus Obscuribacter sp.]HNG74785.1 hypothetical protein [Candidatus Obscuribacter sp.]HNM48512.1 hypothetical protein [Candidatus Obscuribacter sp.]
MSCKCSNGCAVTGSVLVTVNAASAADALAIARGLANFDFDENAGVLELTDGQFLFSGDASQPLSDSAIVSVCPNGTMHAISTGGQP